MRKRSKVKDYIHSLSDDILISILSLLPVKEAVITSSLSKRWKNLWTNISRLDFCDKKFIENRSDDELCVERPFFVDWVNNVIGKYEGEHLQYLRISFGLDNSSKGSIDAWLKFATAKKVETLELNFHHSPKHGYSFPEINFCLSNALVCLKTLSLTNVNLHAKSLQCILACCPLLQSLSLFGSGKLEGNLKFSGSSLRLRDLDISFCVGRYDIDISDINLVSFCCHSCDSDVIIRNVPKLEKVSIGFGSCRLGNKHFDMLLRCRHIRSLELNMQTYCPKLLKSSSVFPNIPEFPELDQLTIIFEVNGDDSLLGFTSLVKAFPKLSSLVLQLIMEAPSRRIRKFEQPSKHAHPNLKYVEIKGYYGRISDAELAIYFLENATNLQKMVVDTEVYCFFKVEKTARIYAKKQLKGKKPLGVQLVIL